MDSASWYLLPCWEHPISAATSFKTSSVIFEILESFDTSAGPHLWIRSKRDSASIILLPSTLSYKANSKLFMILLSSQIIDCVKRIINFFVLFCFEQTFFLKRSSYFLGVLLYFYGVLLYFSVLPCTFRPVWNDPNPPSTHT